MLNKRDAQLRIVPFTKFYAATTWPYDVVLSVAYAVAALCTTLRRKRNLSHKRVDHDMRRIVQLGGCTSLQGCIDAFNVGLSMLIVLAAVLSKRWYLSGGRTRLLRLARIALVLAAFATFCVLPSAAPQSQHAASSTASAMPSKTINQVAQAELLPVLWLPALRLVPIRLHLRAAAAELALVLLLSFLLHTWRLLLTGLLPTAIFLLAGGGLLPLLVVAAYEWSLRRLYHSQLEGQQQGPRGCSITAHAHGVPPTHNAEPPATSQEASRWQQDSNLQAAVPAGSCGLASSAGRRQAHRELPQLHPNQLHNKAAIVGGRLRMPYSSATATSILSAKILHHSAYAQKDSIIPTLTRRLETAPGAPSQDPTAPHPPPFLLSTAALRGCLQLIFSASTLDGSGAPLPPASTDPTTFLHDLHGQLPGEFRHATAGIHMSSTYAAFGRGSADPLSLPGGTSSLLPGVRPGGLGILPIAVEAGQAAGAEVQLWVAEGLEQVAAAGAPGGVPGGSSGRLQGVVDVQAVVWCRRGGEWQAAQSRVLLRAGGAARLPLPPSLDVGPVSIYLLSSQAHQPGALLASLTTMALPSAAVAELHTIFHCAPDPQPPLSIITPAAPSPPHPSHQLPTPPHPAPPPPPEDDFQQGVRKLLNDLALCWQLLDRPDNCPPGAMSLVAAVLQYMADNQLPSCCTVLSDRCAASNFLIETLSRPATPPATPDPGPSPTADNPTTNPTHPHPYAKPVRRTSTSSNPQSRRSSTSSAPTSPAPQRHSPTSPRPTPQPASTSGTLTPPTTPTAAQWQQYAAWKMQHARWLDRAAAVIFSMVWASYLLRMWKAIGSWPHLLSSALGIAPLYLLHVVPYAALACGRPAVRARRSWIMLAQCVLRGVVMLLMSRGMWSYVSPAAVAPFICSPAAFALNGVLKPALAQVPWLLQVLLSTVDEVVRLSTMGEWLRRNADALPNARQPLVHHSVLIVVGATLVSFLVDWWYFVLYRAQLPGACQEPGGGRPAATGASQHGVPRKKVQ